MTNELLENLQLILTEDEERSQAYLNYPGRPVYMDFAEAIDTGVLTRRGRNYIYTPTGSDAQWFGDKKVTITPSHQYNLIGATMSGLNDALLRAEKGVELRDRFEPEFAKFEEAQRRLRPYGAMAFHRSTGQLVFYAPKEWHRLSLVTSNSTQYLDPEKKKSWDEVREIFDNLVIATAGASVGSVLTRNALMDIRMKRVKIADHNRYKVSNGNRVWLLPSDIVWSEEENIIMQSPWALKNKAIGGAANMQLLDPTLLVWAYFEGINNQNLPAFLGGNKVEPRVDIANEETDDADTKVDFRLEARKQRVRVVMGTDEGSAAQIDIRPFDTNPDATLAYGKSDAEIFEKQHKFHEKPSFATFLDFATSLIGDHFQTMGEFGDLMMGKLPKWTASMPQLGSTAATTGAIVTEVIARTALGHKYPERFIFDKSTGLTIRKWGDLV